MGGHEQRLAGLREDTRMNSFRHMTLTGLILLLVPMSAIAGVNQWSGTGPFATGLGNRVITSLAVSADGRTVYAGTGSGTVFIYSVSPPTIAKAFGAASIPLSGTTGLTFTITNPNSSTTLTGIAFTDTLPAGLAVASPNGLAGDCGGGTITAVQGTGVISLSGASMAAGGSCAFSVNVTGIAAGTQNNTTGNVTSVEGGTGGTASAFISVNITLSIAFAGSGGGTVTSTLPDSAINCIKGSPGGCSADYPAGTSVRLAATGDWKSQFINWSDGVTSSVNPVNFSMDAGRTVTAIFDPDFKVRLMPGTALFASIQDAYASVPSGSMTVQAQAWSFLEELLFNNSTAVTLTGGMDASYNPTSGYATVKSLTVGRGSAVIGNITIK
jgi:hypothetical protein